MLLAQASQIRGIEAFEEVLWHDSCADAPHDTVSSLAIGASSDSKRISGIDELSTVSGRLLEATVWPK